jgi:putative Ca2+/H+ antiporter (TMEM165/GDT1 family)
MILDKRKTNQVFLTIAIELVVAQILAVIGALSGLSKDIRLILMYAAILLMLFALVDVIVLYQNREVNKEKSGPVVGPQV